MTVEHQWLKAIGRNLRGEKDIAGEDLPQRWVDLIHYLDERERKSAASPTDANGVIASSRNFWRKR